MDILKKEPNIDHYIEENSDNMVSGELREYIAKLIAEKKLTISKVSIRGQVSDSYLYKINQGLKNNISRDKVIQLCFGFGLDIEESQKLLRIARVGELYPRIKRDSIILFCLENHMDIIECDKKLEEAGDKIIIRE